jgi:dihydropteroate synthase
MQNLKTFELFHRPLLVGISRKSMLTRLLNIETANALNATTALNAFALDRGASILRVHDVAEARQAVEIYSQLVAK